VGVPGPYIGGTKNVGGMSRTWPIIILAAVAVIIVVVTIGYAFSTAEVTGRTSQERIDSICKLADEKPRGAGDAIAAAAVGESDPAVRKAAFLALGRFAGDKHRQVVEAGTRDADAAVRASAAATLGLYDDDAAACRLGELLTGDPDEAVRMGALTGLGHIRGLRATALVVRAIEGDDRLPVRLRAMQTLGVRFGFTFRDPTDPRTPAGAARIRNTLKMLPAVTEALEKYPPEPAGGDSDGQAGP